MTRDEPELRKVSFTVHATRGVIRDPAMRRKMMAGLIIVAVVMLISGTTWLQETLNAREHVLRFILFWVVCAWFTLAALLLALFDALMVRAQGRAARRKLQDEFKERSGNAANKRTSR